jgi:predicted Zn-ribbon and HTH transcriptional regulator
MGLAYHKYREIVELVMKERKVGMSNEIHDLGLAAALDGWEDPPIGHDEEYLDKVRLYQALQIARKRIEIEQKSGSIEVTRSESAFDLELPYAVCLKCGWAFFSEEVESTCSRCGHHPVLRARHGGRVDQFVVFNRGYYIRDFKNTKWKMRRSSIRTLRYRDTYGREESCQGVASMEP